MKLFAHSFGLVTGFVLLLSITPSWGQPVCAAPGCNPTASDEHANTGGGTAALILPTGSGNTAFGDHALFSNSTGSDNTASGRGALRGNTDGQNNTASGASALQFNTDGDNNTAIGVHALDNNLTGSKNTAIGVEALVHSLGNKNIAIGFRAGSTLTNGNNNIYLDNLGVAEESQTMRLGDTQTRTFIVGIASANVNGATVEVDANGQLGIKNSSARYKRDIAPMGTSSEKVLALRPVTFAYKDDAQGVTRYGLIAEEVATVYPELVTRTGTGEVQTVKYQELIPMLLNELQRQRQEFQQQLAELRALVGQGRGAEAVSPNTTVVGR